MKQWNTLFYDSIAVRTQFYQLPCCNLFTHHVFFWRDTARDLWTLVLFSYIVYNRFNSFHHHLLAGNISLSSYFTSAQLLLCVRQAGELTTSLVRWGIVLVCDCVQVHVNYRKWRCWHLAKPYPSPTRFDNLGFVIKGNCCFAASYLPLGVSQLTCDPRHHFAT